MHTAIIKKFIPTIWGVPYPIIVLPRLILKASKLQTWSFQMRDDLMTMIFLWSLVQVSFSLSISKELEEANSRSPANSAYEDAIPWIKKLQVFLKDLLDNHKKVKICGKFERFCRYDNRAAAYQVYALDIKSSVVCSAANASLVDNGRLVLPQSISLTWGNRFSVLINW